MTERFTEIINDRNAVRDGICGTIGNSGRYFIGKAIDKLAEYETAEDEGRLVVLPCKSGKDLFGIYNGTIVEGYADGYLLEKTSVHSDADHWIWLQDKNSKNYWKIAFAEIGKTVFLTREEAEKALEEMEKYE